MRFTVLITILLMANRAMAATPLDCAAYPIRSDCCPTPCPVIDLVKNADLQDTAQKILSENAEIDIQKNNTNNMMMAIGKKGLKTFLSDISFFSDNQKYILFSDYNNNINDLLTTVSNEWLPKKEDTISVVTNKQQVVLSKLREEALEDLAKTENYITYSNDAHLEKLSAISAMSNKDIRELMQKNTAAKLAVNSQFVNIKELMAMLVAIRSLNNLSIEKNYVAVNQSPYNFIPKNLDPSTQKLLTDLYTILEQALFMHNYQVDALKIASSITILEETINNHELSIKNKNSSLQSIDDLVMGLYHKSGAASSIEKHLRTYDTTSYTDNFVKGSAANNAAIAVLKELENNPSIFGINSNVNLTTMQKSSFQNLFETHLENIKLEEYWQPLRIEADKRIDEALSQLNSISNEIGVAVLDDSAKQKTQNILNQFYEQAKVNEGKLSNEPLYKTLLNIADSIVKDTNLSRIITFEGV